MTMEGDSSPPPSICMLRAAEFFPKSEPEREEESLQIQFNLCKCKI